MRNRLDRLHRLADRLDSRFSVLGIRFGWDSILGLIPGIGDVATALPTLLLLYEGARMGARRRVLARIAGNTGIDVLIGGIPVIGDAFDVAFKSHRRNIRLLEQEFERLNAQGGYTMAERKRSKDGVKETEKVLGARGTVSQSGRAGGELQRDIASEDELKRASERPAGKTRVTKSKDRQARHA